MTTQIIPGVKACTAGVLRFRNKYEGKFSTISHVILDAEVPQEDIDYVCLMSSKLDSCFNFKNINKRASQKLNLKQWSLLVAGQPHLYAFSPKEKFRGWHLVTILKSQPDLYEKIAEVSDISMLTDSMWLALTKEQESLLKYAP